MIKQVRFYNWGTGPKGYWRDIRSIAAFIAARLQHPNPPCNCHNPRISTIKIHQYKEKWGAVNVYCDLANSDEVQAYWEECGNIGKYDRHFFDKCMFKDMVHYRQCYMDMIAIVPHLREAICDSADYRELLLNEPNKNNFILARYYIKSQSELYNLFKRVYDYVPM